MFCTKCGKQISTDAVFCTWCGNKVVHTHNQNLQTAQEASPPQPVPQPQPVVAPPIQQPMPQSVPQQPVPQPVSQPALQQVPPQPMPQPMPQPVPQVQQPTPELIPQLIIPEEPKLIIFSKNEIPQKQKERLAELVRLNPFLFDIFSVTESTQPTRLSDDFLLRHVYRMLHFKDLRKKLFGKEEPVIDIGGIKVPACVTNDFSNVKAKRQTDVDILLLEQGMIYFTLLKSLELMCDFLGVEKDFHSYGIMEALDSLSLIATRGDKHIYAFPFLSTGKEIELLMHISDILFYHICNSLGTCSSTLPGLGGYRAGFVLLSGFGGLGTALSVFSVIGASANNDAYKRASAFASFNQIVDLFNYVFPDLESRDGFLQGFDFDEEYPAIEKQVDGMPCLEVVVNGETKLYTILYQEEFPLTKTFSKKIIGFQIQFVAIPFEPNANKKIRLRTMHDVLIFGAALLPEEPRGSYDLFLFKDVNAREEVIEQFKESTGLHLNIVSFHTVPSIPEDTPYYIDNDNCTSCSTCSTTCPVEAISGNVGAYVIGNVCENDFMRHIDGDMCLACGACHGQCPSNAIIARYSSDVDDLLGL